MKKIQLLVFTLLLVSICFLPMSVATAQSANAVSMVRLIYFRPNDRASRPDRVTALRGLIKDVQKFYADEMQRHGYGRKTFTIETDRKGEPLVHHVNGRFNDAYYHQKTINKVWEELNNAFDTPQRIYFVVIDISTESLDRRCGGARRYNEQREKALLIPASGHCFNIPLAAHEFGHAFGLEHDFRDTAYIMSYGSNPNSISKCTAEWLDAHGYFNNASARVNRDASIEMLAPTAAPPNGIRLRFEVNDVDRLHQAQLYLKPTLADPALDYKLDGCHLLDAESDTIEFVTSELVDPSQDEVTLQVIDKHGGMKRETFPIKFAHLLPPPKDVSIPDQNLAAALREALKLGGNARIPERAMQTLTKLDARDSNIKNLAGLEHATGLRVLELRDNQIRDIRPLVNLKNLTELILDNNRVSDIRPLTNMKQLTWLLIGKNPISDFTPIKNLTELRGLSFWGNNVRDVTLFADLTKLTNLWLGLNKISNITPLADLVNLKVLSLHDNQIRDVSPLAGLVNLETLHLGENPIQDTSPLASLTKLRDVDIEIPQVKAGPKIEGPWLWTIVPTGGSGGRAAAVSGRDWLATASGGAVREQQIATRGAIAGAAVGNKAWTPGKLAPTGGDNITQMVNAIGLGTGDIDHHVAYGSIAFHSPRQQNTELYVGSDDAVKVWLNGVLVHNNPVDRGASDYQDAFPVTLKQGKNILLVAVYEQAEEWSGFFGFEKAAVYSLVITPVVQVGASERPPMYWINVNSGTLHRLVGAEVENLVPSIRNATGLAIDVAGGKLYWTERTGDSTGRIRRANLDGRNVQLVKNLTSVPQGIALDAANGKIYVTNAWGKIQRLNVDGSNFQPNLITDLERPRGLALDVSGGKVYWAETTGRIRRANLDGSNIEDVATGLGNPINIAIFDNTVYWTEKIGENSGEIRFVNLQGNVVTRNSFTQGFPVGIAVDAVERTFYWTTSHGKIGRQALDGSNFQPNFVTGLSAPGPLALRVETPMDVETPEILTTDALLSISPSPVISPAVGEQLTLNLKITAGEAVAGYQFTVRFDPTALRYVESGNGEYLPTGAFFVQPVVNRDRVELAATALAGVSNGDGTLATLTFEVMAVKPSTLTLSEPLFADDQGNTFLPRVEGGEITEPPKLKGDVNGDGVVNIQDLVLVASSFGETGENSADINADGVVNIADLVLVAGNLGTGLGAPSLDPGALGVFTAADVREWLSQAHQLNSVSPTDQRGVSVLEQLLAVLTPKETTLLPNYPNPFNPETWIPYQLATSGDVKISIYDARGIVVRRLELGYRQAGYYTNRSRAAYWDGCNGLGEHVASGLYFYHLEAEGVSLLRKMVTLK